MDTEDSSNSDMVTAKNVLEGDCSLKVLKNCSTTHLECLLRDILKNESLEVCNHRPKWWPEELVSYGNLNTLRNEVSSMIKKWHFILAKILATCSEFHERSQCLDHRRNELPTKFKKRPFVILKDILKGKDPMTKDDFMDSLNLQRSDLRATQMTSAVTRNRYSKRLQLSSNTGHCSIQSSKYGGNSKQGKSTLDIRSDESIVLCDTKRKRKRYDNVTNTSNLSNHKFFMHVEVVLTPLEETYLKLKKTMVREDVSVIIDKRQTDDVYRKKYGSNLLTTEH